MDKKWYKNLQESLLINKDLVLTEDINVNGWSNDYNKLLNTLNVIRYEEPVINILCDSMPSEFGNGTDIYYNPFIETTGAKWYASLARDMLEIDRDYTRDKEKLLWKIDDNFLYINSFDENNRGARKISRIRFMEMFDIEIYNSIDIELDYDNLDALIPDNKFKTGAMCKAFLYKLLNLKDGYERAFIYGDKIYLLKNVVKPKQLAIKGSKWFTPYSSIENCVTSRSRVFDRLFFVIESDSRFFPKLIKYKNHSPKEYFK